MVIVWEEFLQELEKRVKTLEAHTKEIEKSLWSINFEHLDAAMKACEKVLASNEPHEYKLKDDVEVYRGSANKWEICVYLGERDDKHIYVWSTKDGLLTVEHTCTMPLKESK